MQIFTMIVARWGSANCTSADYTAFISMTFRDAVKDLIDLLPGLFFANHAGGPYLKIVSAFALRLKKLAEDGYSIYGQLFRMGVFP